MRTLCLSILVIAIAGACRTTVEPAKPWASGGDVAVTLGQPFGVWTSWEGECEPGMMDMLGGAFTANGRKTIPCNFVDYDITVACDGACTHSVDNMKTILITPTKLGVLKASVTLNPKSGILKRKKTIALAPVFVVNPTAAAAMCELGGDGKAQIDVTLVGENKQLIHKSDVKVSGGEACTENTGVAPYGEHQRGYTCKIDALNAKLEVSSAHYKLESSAACALIYPAPTQATRLAEGHAFKIYDPYNNQCPALLDQTKTNFAQWGWTIGAIDDKDVGKTEHGRPTGKASLTAERLGTTVTVRIVYNDEKAEEQGCTWTMDGAAGAVRGTDQLTKPL
jgi:hypothetical protein